MRSNGAEEDPFGPMRANAPVSVVKAAKASLKEPTRPHTPADVARGLFASAEPNRPVSSYGLPSSKQFYEGSSKLGLSASARQDSKSRSILFADSQGGGRTSSQELRSSRQSPAETVAALKAAIAANENGGAGVYLEDRDSGGDHSIVLERFKVAESSSDDEEGGPSRPTLDPHRNDDLPPRPGTSRGRSSSGLDGYPMSIGDAAPPKPSVLDGAQVLDIAPGGASDDEDINDESYRHLYNYNPSDDPVHLGLKKSDRSDSSGGPPGLPPRPPSAPSTAVKQIAAAAAAAAACDPSDPFVPWRFATEQTLTSMAAAVENCDCSRESEQALLDVTSVLASHVEYLRKQHQSSRWLKSSSITFLDTRGQQVSMREAIAEHVFRLMDYSSTELLLKACGILLRVVKARQPLLQTAKMLYRLSKDTTNDAAFRKEFLLEPILRTVHIMVASSCSSSGSSGSSSMHEPLVFLNGCLKNISNDSVNQKALVRLGAMGVLANLLNQMGTQVIASTHPASPSSSSHEQGSTADRGSTFINADTAGQVAVQVTGVLRNFAVSPTHTPFFVSSGAMTALRVSAEALPCHAEVVLNIGRILSKLSLQQECQAALEADTEYAPLLLSLMKRYSENRAILLRVAFVLGNLTGSSPGYRHQVSIVPGALASVISIMHSYTFGSDARPTSASPSSSNSSRVDRLSKAATRQDCLIKILRLTANLAISPEAGPLLAENDVVADSLTMLLGTFAYADAEELVLNCVCALTNLSFYYSPNNKILSMEPSKLLRYVTPLLMCENEEAMVEAARTYGNFSRVAEARAYMEKARVLEALILLLDHSSSELLYSVCGTLINFTADAARKGALVGLGCFSRLMDVMERVATGAEITAMEVAIITVVLKALYNICADDRPLGSDTSNASSSLGPCSISAQEFATLPAVLGHVRRAAPCMIEACPEGEEVLPLVERLGAQVQRLGGKVG